MYNVKVFAMQDRRPASRMNTNIDSYITHMDKILWDSMPDI